MGEGEEEESFRCTSPDRAVRLAAAIPITRPVRRGAARRDCRHNPKKTETAGTFAVSGEGCPDRAIQKVHLPADEHRSSLD